MSDDRQARRYHVSGDVQGVGFRWFVARAARSLGVDGVARNLPDGTVEVLAMGAAEALERLEAVVRQGPPSARVAAVGVSEVPVSVVPTGGFERR